MQAGQTSRDAVGVQGFRCGNPWFAAHSHSSRQTTYVLSYSKFPERLLTSCLAPGQELSQEPYPHFSHVHKPCCMGTPGHRPQFAHTNRAALSLAHTDLMLSHKSHKYDAHAAKRFTRAQNLNCNLHNYTPCAALDLAHTVHTYTMLALAHLVGS